MKKIFLHEGKVIEFDTKNESHIQYLKRTAEAQGIEVIEADVDEVKLLVGSFFDWNLTYRHYIEGHQNVLEYLTIWHQIYKDTHPTIILVIPRQTGKTTLLAGKLAYNGTSKRNHKTTYITFSDESLRSFSNDKYRDSLLHRENEEIYKLVRRAGQTLGQLHRIEFLTRSTSNLVTHAGDMHHVEGKSVDEMILDELQNLNLDAYVTAKESQAWTQGPELMAGIGGYIGTQHHKEWLESNQNKWKYIDDEWRKKLRFLGVNYHELQDGEFTQGNSRLVWGDYLKDALKGYYEPQAPENNEKHGYTFTQEDMPNIPMTKLDALKTYHVPITASIQYKREKYPESWLMRHVYAYFIQGELKPLIESQVRACFDKNANFVKAENVDHSKGLVIVSADWGGGSKAFTIPHVIQWIDEDIPIARLLYVAKWTESDVDKQAQMFINLCDAYEADKISTDAGGGTHQVQTVEKRYGSRFVKVSYHTRPAQVLPSNEEMKKMRKENRFTIDRSFALEMIFDLIKRHHEFNQYSFPRYQIPALHSEELNWYVEHLTADEGHLIKVKGQDYTDYDHPDTQPDDALHSLVYNWIGFILARKDKTWWSSFN